MHIYFLAKIQFFLFNFSEQSTSNLPIIYYRMDHVMDHPLFHQRFTILQDRFSKGQISSYEAELVLEDIKSDVGKTLEKALWKQLPNDVIDNIIPCSCGNYLVYKGTLTNTFRTFHAQITFSRRYFTCSQCNRSLFPLDHILGLEHVERFSPRVVAVIGRLAAEQSYNKTRCLVRDLFGFKISNTAVENIAEKLGQDILSQQPCHELTADDAIECNRFYIFIDGKFVPFRSPERKGPRVFHEVKVTVVVKEWLNGKQEIFYLAKYANSQEFGHYMDLHVQGLGILKAKEVIVVANGADWIWNWVSDTCPPEKTVRINDWYHSVEYSVEAIKWLTRKEEVKQTPYYRELIGLLEVGNIYELIDVLTRWGKSNKVLNDKDNPIRKAITYYTNGKDRMAYDEYEKKGYIIGSGRVEGANKSIIDARFCQSGMAWSEESINKIIALRLLITNQRYKQFLCRWFRATPDFAFI